MNTENTRMDQNTVEELLATYPDLSDAVAERRKALADAADADQEADSLQAKILPHVGDLEAARLLADRRKQTAAARQHAEDAFAVEVERARNAAERREEARKRKEWAAERESRLAAAREGVARSLRDFDESCRALVELVGGYGEPEEEIARIMGTTIGRSINFGAIWSISRAFV
jgi:hypothetical protein